MRTKQELKQLAIDIVENKVFGTWNLPERDQHLAPAVFIPLALLSKEQLKEIEKDKIVHFFEYVDRAGPRSVNGMPTFFSVQKITRDELNIVLPIIKEYTELKQKFQEKKDD